MRLLGLPGLLLLLTATALADPFGPATQLTNDSAAYVSVASTNAGPVTVWIAADVRANGHLVGEEPTRVAVASTGDTALVVWRTTDGSVKARRVRPDGTPSAVERVIARSSGSGAVTVVAFEDRYLVAWAGPFGAVYAAIVTSLGDPIVPAMPVTTQSPSTIGELAGAASADGFALVWHTWLDAEVFATTLSANGVPVSMTPLLITADGAYPDVTSNGRTFFVVWGEGISQTIYARTLTLARELGRVRAITTGAFAPRVAWDGFAYGLAFAREVRPRPATVFHQLTVTRINEQGAVLERLVPENSIVPRSYDVDARGGRLDLGYSTSGVAVQSATMREPRTRVRVVRH